MHDLKMENHSTANKAWKKLGASVFGRWLFSKIVCFKAPYFKTVNPRISSLEKNLCEGYLIQARRIENHIGSIHAIALCNLAELCAGLMTDVSIPADMRWIPKEMRVQYLEKAKGKIIAKATPASEFYSSETGYNTEVNVLLTNPAGQTVFSASITMWVSKKVTKAI